MLAISAISLTLSINTAFENFPIWVEDLGHSRLTNPIVEVPFYDD
jgi:hypothetical protein